MEYVQVTDAMLGGHLPRIEGDWKARSLLARWCVNCGRWLFRCQCRESLPYCYPQVVGTVEVPR